MAYLVEGRYNPLGYFKHSGQLLYRERNHNPFIVIRSLAQDTVITIEKNAKGLLTQDPNALVMVLWEGKITSLYYCFYIRDLLNYLAETPEVRQQIEEL